MTKEIIFSWSDEAFVIIRNDDLYNLIKAGGVPSDIKIRLYDDQEKPEQNFEDYYKEQCK